MLSSPTSVRFACLFSKTNGAHNNMPAKEGLKGNVRLDPHEDLDNTDGVSPSGGVSSSMRRSRYGSATPKATCLSFLCFFHAPASLAKTYCFAFWQSCTNFSVASSAWAEAQKHARHDTVLFLGFKDRAVTSECCSAVRHFQLRSMVET